MENGIHHIQMHYTRTHSLTDPRSFHSALYTKMQSFVNTLKSDPHFFVFNGTIQAILVAFSTKTSKDSTGMLSSENDYFNFLKTAQNIKSTCFTYPLVPWLVELFYLSKPVCR